MTHTLRKQYLYQFIADIAMTGEIEEFRHPKNPSVISTPFVQRVADTWKADWLIDAIAHYLTPTSLKIFVKNDPRINEATFWKLTVADNHSALLEGRADPSRSPFIRRVIEHTDVPLLSIDIWAAFDGTYWTLFLPNEH